MRRLENERMSAQKGQRNRERNKTKEKEATEYEAVRVVVTVVRTTVGGGGW